MARFAHQHSDGINQFNEVMGAMAQCARSGRTRQGRTGPGPLHHPADDRAGYEVRGVAPSGIAAENLESGSGIASRTIASMDHGWGQGYDLLTARDVLVIDEAGMVGTRELESRAVACRRSWCEGRAGRRYQLQSIEAGAAFRSIHERHGGTEIGEVRRQREDWQRYATRGLATGRTGEAIHAYDAMNRAGLRP
jgi:ATP-dependent exoDNAse (exonuclease V) alpha subunit